MKRPVCVLLAALALGCLAACGGASGAAEASGTSAAEKSAAVSSSAPASAGSEAPQPSQPGSAGGAEHRVLVAYFSCTGHTGEIAKTAADALGADLYEIVPQTPYTEADRNYNDKTSRTTREQNDPAARPAISGGVQHLEDYDVVLLGYPIWWGQAPRIISTFLESYDFSGKTIVPFCTSASSGVGSSADALHGLCSAKAVWLDGTRFAAGASRSQVTDWLGGLGLGLSVW